MKKAAITFHEWREALREATEEKAEQVPKGWITTSQLSGDLGISLSRTSERLRTLVRAGKAETKKFRIITGTGKLFPVAHYRLRNGPNGAKISGNGSNTGPAKRS